VGNADEETAWSVFVIRSLWIAVVNNIL